MQVIWWGSEDTVGISLGQYKCYFEFAEKSKQAYGNIIQTAEDEFLVAGINLKVSFLSNTAST